MHKPHARLGFHTLAASTIVLSITSTIVSIEATIADGRRPMYADRAIIDSSYWILWALFSPLIAAATSRFPFERKRWLHSLAVHMPLGFGLSFVHIVALQGIRRGLMLLTGRTMTVPFWRTVQQSALAQIDWNMMAYWMIVGAALAVMYREEALVRERAAARLETELVQAQLNALQAHLHPHFLFNALHTVSALMHRDVDLAERTLARIADLLRTSLRDLKRQDVPLREELDFTRNYLEIEQTRLGDRMTVNFDIEPETLGVPVPWMVLQPLVENAVKHGIAPQSQPGAIDIVARHEGGRLALTVRDNGAGLQIAAGGVKYGVGLEMTRERLRHQFGEKHVFEMRPLERGVEVCVVIPWRQPIQCGAVPASGAIA